MLCVTLASVSYSTTRNDLFPHLWKSFLSFRVIYLLKASQLLSSPGSSVTITGHISYFVANFHLVSWLIQLSCVNLEQTQAPVQLALAELAVGLRRLRRGYEYKHAADSHTDVTEGINTTRRRGKGDQVRASSGLLVSGEQAVLRCNGTTPWHTWSRLWPRRTPFP